MRSSIAQKLVQLRGNRTQDEIAKAIGVSRTAIMMYENGQRVPKDEIKVKLAQYYQVSLVDLFFSSESHISVQHHLL